MMVWPTPKPALLGAITILSEAFDGVAFVSAKLPARDRPERFVRVSRIGGGLDDPTTDNARILVECFAKDVGECESMCNTARTALRNAGGTTVTSGDISMFVRAFTDESGPTEFLYPDLLDYDRWQFSGTLSIKAN